MANLPENAELTGASVTQGQFKAAVNNLLEFLRGTLGVTGTVAAVRTTLGLGSLATRNSVGAADITAGAVGGTQLAAGAVLTDRIGDGQVTGAKLAVGAAAANLGFTPWGPANDGAGSGLDADLLDGAEGALFARRDAVNTFTATQAYQPVNLVDGPNIAWNLDAGNLAHVTLGGAGRTLSLAGTLRPGTYILILRQDNTGGRSVTTWPAQVRWMGGAVPLFTTAANKVDVVTFVSDGTSMFAGASLNG